MAYGLWRSLRLAYRSQDEEHTACSREGNKSVGLLKESSQTAGSRAFMKPEYSWGLYSSRSEDSDSTFCKIKGKSTLSHKTMKYKQGETQNNI
jgi:hypothetical protein